MIEGRSLRAWNIRAFRGRRGYLRPNDGVSPPHQVDLVRDEGGRTFGALRRFADRRERAEALALLGTAGPAGPALLDLVDVAESPPAIVTAWAPGRSEVPLDQLIEPDDLLAQLQSGRRWKPAEALRLLVPLGDALDRFAERGFVPVELSPDHLVENGGGLRLVGLGRHLYKPRERRLPSPSGMSLPTTQLLCDDMPGTGAAVSEWRRVQLLMLLRLAGWMCGGLPPGAWGRLSGTDGQHAYLRDSGFASIPSLAPGSLATSLAEAAVAERHAEAEQRIREAACVLFFDDGAVRQSAESREEWQRSLVGKQLNAKVIEVEKDRVRVELAGPEKWSFNVFWRRTPEGEHRSGFVDLKTLYVVGERVTVVVESLHPLAVAIVLGAGADPEARRKAPPVNVNPEAVRLGLLEEHGPGVVAVAAVPAHRQTSAIAALLSGAGWVMVEPNRLGDVLRTVRRLAPSARIVIAGRPGSSMTGALPSSYEEVRPGQAEGAFVAGRSAAALPFVADADLNAYGTELLHDRGGAALRRRTFAAGWALALNEEALEYKRTRAAKDQGRQLRNELAELNTLFGADTELLLRVAEMRGRPGLRTETWTQMRARLREAAPVLSGMPAYGALRNDLMHALLSRTPDSLHGDVTRRMLPVAPRLARIYRPELLLGGTSLHELLYSREGIRRLGLLGRLATALPDHPVPALLDEVAPLEQRLVDALLDVPAPSLQYLVGRLGSGRLFEVLRPFIDGPDLDLLGQYTPTAWRLLLEGLRQPEHLSALGLGWALVVERDPSGLVDARTLLEISRLADVAARYTVRAMLETPTDQWAAVLAAPGASARWLASFGRLDLAPVLEAFPEAEELLHEFSPLALRAAAAAGLTAASLKTLAGFAAGTGVDAGDVVTVFVDIKAEAGDAAVFEGPAPTAWAALRLAEGRTLEDVCLDLIERPGLLRDWLVDGDKPVLRVLTGILGAEPKSLGVRADEGKRLVATMEAQPSLLALVRDLMFPSQRLRLLRIALSHPGTSLARQTLRDALPDLLDAPDADAVIAMMLADDLTVDQARLAARHRLDADGRALLRMLGPLPLDDDLLAVATVHGPAAARDTAIAGQRRPRAAKAVRHWGPRWLPLIAGPDGEAVSRLLASHPDPAPGLSPWLLAAGEDGLMQLGRHGHALLDLIREAGPPPADVRILGEILRMGGTAATYRLIVRHGLPYPTWTTVIAQRTRDPEDVLLDLWSGDGWAM